MHFQIEINREPCVGEVFRNQDGLLIRLSGIEYSHAAPFEELFRPLPEVKVAGGFVEFGEYAHQAYEFEGNVPFYLGPDGAVWAKICANPNELPSAEECEFASEERLSLRIPDKSEESCDLKPTANERL